MPRWFHSVLLAMALSTSYEVMYYILYKYMWKRKDNSLMDVIFFPDKTVACEAHFTYGCTQKNCWLSHEETSSLKLIKYLMDAELTMDICVYCLASEELVDAVLKAHTNGVIVRVVTDAAQAAEHSSVIGKLRAGGTYTCQNCLREIRLKWYDLLSCSKFSRY